MSRLLTDIACLRELAAVIDSPDGVPNAALREIADRLERIEEHARGIAYWHARSLTHPVTIAPIELAKHVAGLGEVCR